MKSQKLFVLRCLMLLSLSAGAQLKIKKYNFFSDTTVESNGYKIGLKDTYIRKNLFIRTTVIVTNPTDQFLLIDKDNILVSTNSVKGEASLYSRTIVVPPGEVVTFPLKFTAKDYQSPVISLNFTGIKMTSGVKLKHPEIQMPLELKNQANSGGIQLTIIRSDLKAEGLAVRIRVQYHGDYLVKQNIYAISLQQDSCFNFKKYKRKSYLDPNRNNELLWLLFPKECALKTKVSKRVLVFKDVFSELSMQPVPDVKLSIRYLPDAEKSIKEEKEKPDKDTD